MEGKKLCYKKGEGIEAYKDYLGDYVQYPEYFVKDGVRHFIMISDCVQLGQPGYGAFSIAKEHLEKNGGQYYKIYGNIDSPRDFFAYMVDQNLTPSGWSFSTIRPRGCAPHYDIEGGIGEMPLNNFKYRIYDEKLFRFIREKYWSYVNGLLGNPKIKGLQKIENARFHSITDYIRPGDSVTDELVEEMRDCVPPSRCTSTIVQCGEPYHPAINPHTNRWSQQYLTFTKRNETWIFSGPQFLVGKHIN